MNEEKYQKVISLANELITQVRAETLVSLRFLDTALFKLKLRYDVNTSLYTDGEYLVMNPYYIFSLYKEENNLLLRNYLHIVLHCIFFHIFIDNKLDKDRWNLACDMCVENIINELNLPMLIRKEDNPQIIELYNYKVKAGDLTAEKLYNYFMVYGISNEEVLRLEKIFKRDDHTFWYITTGNIGTNDSRKKSEDDTHKEQKNKDDNIDKKSKEDKSMDEEQDLNDNEDNNLIPPNEDTNDDNKNEDNASNIEGDKNKADTGEEENPNADSTNKSDINKDNRNEEAKQDGDNIDRQVKAKNRDMSIEEDEIFGIRQKINQQIANNDNKIEEKNSKNLTHKEFQDKFDTKRKLNADIENAIYNDWKSISERTKEDLLMFESTWGEKTNSLKQYIRVINRERYSYEKFLKKFSTYGENIELNDEEFDNIYYTYGLNMYKNVPLVEPLEYKEVKKVREFVIAIDVSGSVKGDLVQKFIEKTYNILSQRENFFNKVNIHIILCDTEIKEDYKITSLDELNEKIYRINFSGFGGTDFRPVFNYIDKKRMDGEFSDLKGLIYFTDGLGEFPHTPPDYDSAFVFIKEDYDKNENKLTVPPWAIKIILEDI